MTGIRVTKDQIDELLNSADVEVRTVFDKCTVVIARLRNGFILVESSACVDPANYDPELGKKLCLKRIEDRLWELEGYALQKMQHERKIGGVCCESEPAEPVGDFGWALDKLRCGRKVRRRGWNGKTQYIELASAISYKNANDEIVNVDHAAIGNQAIAVVGTSGVQMGWLASQADMLAEDWELA